MLENKAFVFSGHSKKCAITLTAFLWTVKSVSNPVPQFLMDLLGKIKSRLRARLAVIDGVIWYVRDMMGQLFLPHDHGGESRNFIFFSLFLCQMPKTDLNSEFMKLEQFDMMRGARLSLEPSSWLLRFGSEEILFFLPLMILSIHSERHEFDIRDLASNTRPRPFSRFASEQCGRVETGGEDAFFVQLFWHAQVEI